MAKKTKAAAATNSRESKIILMPGAQKVINEAAGIAPNDGVFDQHRPEIVNEVDLVPIKARKYRLYDQHHGRFVIRNNNAVAPNNFVKQTLNDDTKKAVYSDDELENSSSWHYRHIPEIIAMLLNQKANMDLEFFMLKRNPKTKKLYIK